MEIEIDQSFGDDLTEEQIKNEIKSHISDFIINEESDFGSIDVLSEKCWDCYSSIIFKSIQIL